MRAGSWRTGIRTRLLVWLSTMLTALLLISSLYDFRTTLRAILDTQNQAMLDGVILLSGYLNVEDGRAAFQLPERVLGGLRGEFGNRLVYRVIAPDGATLGGDAGLPTGKGDEPREIYTVERDGRELRVLSQRIGTVIGDFRILVAESGDLVRALRNRVLATRLVVDLSLLGLTLLVVWLVTGAAIRPLKRLAAQVEARSGDDLRPLAREPVPEEVRPLVQSLNHLFGQMAATRDGQRRFVENAAHQLRTPMAALKGQIELASSEVDAATGNDRGLAERMARIRQAADRLNRLANQMLALSRSERQTHAMASRTAIDLPALVDEAVSHSLDSALARRQDLGAETGPATIEGVAWEIRELLSNLIDNAIRYTSEGGRITVRCGTQSGAAFLEVEDDGVGIAGHERSRVLERFYRVPGSAAGGSGLGLAIVKEIADLHGAAIAIHDGHEGRGTRVRVSFGAPGQGLITPRA